MQTILTQKKCIEALQGERSIPLHLTQAEKIKMWIAKKCYYLVSQGHIFKRSLYMNKYLAHKLCLKQQFYSF